MTALNQLTFNAGDNIYTDVQFLLLEGVVEALDGNDMLVATAPGGTTYGQTFLIQNARLSMGQGHDVVKGDGSAGFQSNGLLVAAFPNSEQPGLDMGDGDDIVIGLGSGGGAGGFGVAVFGSCISTGNGRDILIGRSAIATLGIYNAGRIDMGAGDDKILASGMSNGGLITTGSGHDLIEAAAGGSGGEIRLGGGHDVLKGLTDARADGSDGWDTALLPAGTYPISRSGESPGAVIDQVGSSLTLTNFEAIGSWTGKALPLQPGVLSVGSDGSVTYL